MVAAAKSDLSLWTTTPSHVLLTRADRLRAERRFKPAMRMLAVAETNTDDDTLRRTILERLAVTAADAGSHRVSTEAVFSLDRLGTKTASTWVAIARVALARSNFAHADSAAREALALDPDDEGAWASLAASFAGLGWFEESERCLDRVDDALAELDRWRLGRAVNQWSMVRTLALPAAALAAFLVGWLAIAVAVSIPLAVRRLRLRRLLSHHRPILRIAADRAWGHERRLRLLHGSAVAASIAAFTVANLPT